MFGFAKNYCYNVIIYRRAVKAYKKIINNLETKLLSDQLTKAERLKVKLEKEKFELDLHNIEIKNIQIFVKSN
jgi:hypothetical protein